jgi:predicted nucleic acid-binding protein
MVKIKHRIVVADTGPLIHLDELSALDVISDWEIWIPNAVWQELEHHRPDALHHPAISYTRKCPKTPTSSVNTLKNLYTLHHGECEALALCQEYSIFTLLTDDTAARLAAKSLGINAYGTIGLLIRSVRRNFRTKNEVVQLLESIPQRSSLHIRPIFLKEIIAKFIDNKA